ncbi:MAG: hypothetical protein L0H23_00670 [Luteimonas sp.]|nr:hypothetical protein [Luteimonas sp.]
MNEKPVAKLPVGRPPNARSVRVLAARESHAAIRVLADVAADEAAPAVARVEAAKAVLTYATAVPNKPAGGEPRGA